MISTNRSLIKYIILTLLTGGIYSYWFIYKLAHDVNIMCEGDGRNTGGLFMFIFLSIITFGIYPLIWYFNIGNRLYENAPRYNLYFSETGLQVIMWMTFGLLLFGLGPFIAMAILIKNTNALAFAYNSRLY